MWGERQSETDQQGEIAEGGGGVGRVGPSRPSVRPSQGGRGVSHPTAGPVSVPLPFCFPCPGTGLGSPRHAPKESVFSGAGWVMARCGQRCLWEPFKNDLRFHTASLQTTAAWLGFKKPFVFSVRIDTLR